MQFHAKIMKGRGIAKVFFARRGIEREMNADVWVEDREKVAGGYGESTCF